ncbi:MAG TPA: hypothetical protein PK199_10470 [Bacteroidales bacterium]|nr:hypothetical protein [Bacteroidales bacterium]
MKRILLIGTLFLFGFQAFSQAKLNIKWDKPEYLFYQTTELKKLPFTIENTNEDIKKAVINLKTNNTVVKKVILDKKDDGCHLNGIFVFRKNPDVKNFKEILETLNLNDFFVNGKQILTKTLITEEEAHNKAIGFEYKDQVFNTIFNDTSRIEYYDFQIYYAKTKLVYMYGKNFPKYLYDGYVAKYTELLDKQEKAREEFLNRTKKQ